MTDRLRIVHCFRSPVGGIFRHVRDLVEEQIAGGHSVGIVCDSSTGGAFEDAFFAELEPRLELGLHRMAMQRAIGPRDAVALWRTYKALRSERPDVLHSHGAKGGAYARIIGSLLRRSQPRLARIYCPHGGSVHYDAGTRVGRLYFRMERTLERMTDRLVFVSAYERDAYVAKVGTPSCPHDLIPNGLAPAEFVLVVPTQDARDFLYIGMMRDLKGADLFIEALAQLPDATAHMVGDGPDRAAYEARAGELALNNRLTFHEPMPVREAFALARTVVVPSRAESMPYVVLETLAAGRPLIATNVGGIPEIYEGRTETLIEPNRLDALLAAMRADLRGDRVAPDPQTMREDVLGRFSRDAMARAVMGAYRRTLDAAA